MFWCLSQVWIALHIWYPKSQKLASTEQMFGHPYYAGLALDTSIILNRRQDSGKVKFKLDLKKNKSAGTYTFITARKRVEMKKKNVFPP